MTIDNCQLTIYTQDKSKARDIKKGSEKNRTLYIIVNCQFD